MKIAYITARFPFGPGEAFLHPEVQALADLTRDLVIIPARPTAKKSFYSDVSAEVVRLDLLGRRTLSLAFRETQRHPKDVLRMLGRLIGTRYRLKSKLQNVAAFPKALAVAWTVRERGIEHIHAHWLSAPSTIAYVAAELTGLKWSCTAHRYDIFADNLLPAKVHSAQFVRAISYRNLEIVMSKAGDRSEGRCRVIHLGVRLPRFLRPPEENDVVRLICAANLVPVKGHEYLLQALAFMKERRMPFVCDLAGDGPSRPSIERQIERLGLQQEVRLRGHVNHDRLVAELGRGVYDIFVLASIEQDTVTFEGIPMALIEAMAAGVPCVSTRTGSIPEIVDDPASALLVPQRDAAALADGLATLALDAKLRRRVGVAGRECVERAFDSRKTTQDLFGMICAS